MLCRLVKEQSAPDVGIEELDSNSLKFNYFRSMFRETVEKKIDNVMVDSPDLLNTPLKKRESW